MLHSDRFAVDAAYRASAFLTCPADRPLIAQFAATDPEVLFTAASHIRTQVDCWCVNLGCPQAHARAAGYGAYLLDRSRWPLVRRLIHSLLPLDLPVSIKIRLLPTLPLTLTFLTFLADSGVSAIAIHGRQRGSTKRRREGPANMDWLTACAAHLHAHHPDVVVLVNGNVRCFDDVQLNLRTTGADGVLVAEALLANPRLFTGTPLCMHRWAVQALPLLMREVVQEEGLDGGGVMAVVLAREYLDWAERVRGVEWSWVVAHVWNVLRWSVAWDEAVRWEVKNEVRTGVESLADMRRWLDKWEVSSRRELDRRAETQQPLRVRNGKGIGWWKGGGEVGAHDGDVAVDDSFDLSVLSLEVVH